MRCDPAEMTARDIYLRMIQLITPRPIAWVSTCSSDGLVNLAPFSFFNGVGANPPSVVFCPANRPDGEKKDTLRNIEQTGEFVVNIVSHAVADAMNHTAADFPRDINELQQCGLTPRPSVRVAPPAVDEALAQLECRLIQSIQLGTGPAGANLVIGRIVMFQIADDVLDAEGQVDPAKIDTIGRLGGAGYARTTDRFQMRIPPVSTQPQQGGIN